MAWDHGIVGSSPTIPTDAARSFNGSGRRSDKAETKVDSFSGYSMETTKGDLECHDNDGNRYTGPHMGSWCNGSTADF